MRGEEEGDNGGEDDDGDADVVDGNDETREEPEDETDDGGGGGGRGARMRATHPRMLLRMAARCSGVSPMYQAMSLGLAAAAPAALSAPSAAGSSVVYAASS